MASAMRMLLGEKVVIRSPLPAGQARDRLRAATDAFDEDGYRMTGRITGRRIAVSVRRASIRSSWIPILRGRLEDASGGGSRLVATIGWHPAVKVFSAVWLGALALVFLPLFLLNVAYQAATGDARSVAGAIALGLVPVAFLLVFLGLTSIGQAPPGYLRTWLERQLDAPTE